MGRPTDWYVLHLDSDPTPGDPESVRALARTFGGFVHEVNAARTGIQKLTADQALQSFVGLSADAFRGKVGELPGQLDKLSTSYEQATEALTAYAPVLEQAQDDADRALARGREAAAALAAAKRALETAQRQAASDADNLQSLQNVAAGDKGPDPATVQAAINRYNASCGAVSTAQHSITQAQDELDACRQMALQAAALRQGAGKTAAGRVHAASDAGIHNDSWWHHFTAAVADAWHDLVTICKIVVAVLGIVALILGGPIAWIVVAAAAIVLADTLMKYAEGKASLFDVAMAALNCIPLTKGLTSLAALKDGLTAVREMSMAERGAAALGKLRSLTGGAIDTVRFAPSALVNLATSAPTKLADLARTLRYASPGDTLNAAVAAYAKARGEGEGIYSALSKADAARYNEFREGGATVITQRADVDPAFKATRWQGSQGYRGRDPWRNGVVPGDQVYTAGTPGLGNFAVQGDFSHLAGQDASAYNKIVQVGKGDGAYAGFRGQLTTFTVDGGGAAAHAPVIANPQFGGGVAQTLTHRPVVQTFFPAKLPEALASAPVGTVIVDGGRTFTVTGHAGLNPSSLKDPSSLSNLQYDGIFRGYQVPVTVVRGLGLTTAGTR